MTRFIEAAAGLTPERIYWLWTCLNHQTDRLPHEGEPTT